MKKNKKKEKNDDEKLSEKILDLCMWYQIEDSHRWIEIINHRIKFCDIKIQHLLDSKPLFFQKKKLEKFNKDLEELEQEKMNLYKEVGEEVNIIEKLQKSINNDETLDNTDLISNRKISYYDLLGMIKYDTHPNKVSLCVCDDERTYIFDERNYILDNDDETEKFRNFLGDSLSDKSKLEKNIKILQ